MAHPLAFPVRITLAALVASFTLAAVPAAAADDVPTFADRTARDVEDLDRSFAILFDPLAIAVGVYGGDVDVVLGRHFAASLEADVYALPTGAATAFGAGLLFYPGTALHGLYLQPRVVYARPVAQGLARFDWNSDVFGAGATAGWQWTWDYGFTLRVGGGGMYFLGGSGPTSGVAGAVALSGPQLLLDGSLGWAF
jgi:hypothetical protein